MLGLIALIVFSVIATGIIAIGGLAGVIMNGLGHGQITGIGAFVLIGGPGLAILSAVLY